MSTELRRSIRNGFTTQSPASPFKSSSSSSSISSLSASPKSNRNKSAEEKQEFQTTCNRINQAVKTLGDLAVTSNCFEEYRKSSLRYKVATKSVIDEVYKSLSHFDEIMELQPGSDEYRYFADELRKKLAKLLHLNIYCKYKKTNKYGFLCKVFVNEDVPSEDQDLYKIEHEQVRYLMDQILRKKSRNRELTDKQKEKLFTKQVSHKPLSSQLTKNKDQFKDARPIDKEQQIINKQNKIKDKKAQAKKNGEHYDSIVGGDEVITHFGRKSLTILDTKEDEDDNYSINSDDESKHETDSINDNNDDSNSAIENETNNENVNESVKNNVNDPMDQNNDTNNSVIKNSIYKENDTVEDNQINRNKNKKNNLSKSDEDDCTDKESSTDSNSISYISREDDQSFLSGVQGDESIINTNLSKSNKRQIDIDTSTLDENSISTKFKKVCTKDKNSQNIDTDTEEELNSEDDSETSQSEDITLHRNNEIMVQVQKQSTLKENSYKEMVFFLMDTVEIHLHRNNNDEDSYKMLLSEINKMTANMMSKKYNLSINYRLMYNYTKEIIFQLDKSEMIYNYSKCSNSIRGCPLFEVTNTFIYI
jgi:hypothetical protein